MSVIWPGMVMREKVSGVAAVPLLLAGGLAGCGGEKRKMGVSAAAVPISFAGGLARCGGERRKWGWVRPRFPSHLPVVWPGVGVKREKWSGCGRVSPSPLMSHR